jgi:hypothetical protein
MRMANRAGGNLGEQRPSLGVLSETYRHHRAAALHTPTLRLRWEVRRLERHRDRLDDVGLVRLRALRDELSHRGASGDL